METTLPVLIDLFAVTKQTEGKSANTISWYRRMLGRFADFVGPIPLKDLSVDQARAFVASLQSQEVLWEGHPHKLPVKGELSPRTIHCYVRALKVFSSWLHAEGLTREDLFARLKKPKVPKTIIEVLSDEEIKRLYAAINPNCVLGGRLYAIVLVLLDTGIRGDELITLKLADTHITEGYIKVWGKGAKERIVPFGALTKKALLRYMTTWRVPLHEGIEELFVSDEGMPLSYTAFSHAIQRLAKKADVPRLHPHLCRHTFAVRFLMAGGNLAALKMILGHVSLSTTELYLHLAEAHIQVQHKQYSPVDRLGITPGKGKKVVV